MTDGVRRNFLGSDYQTLLDALQRDLSPPPSNNTLADFLGRSGPLGPTRPTGGLGGIFGLAGALAPPPPRNTLADIFGSHPLPRLPEPAPAPVRRGVFFSFHYDDIRRTCIVRKSWKFRPGWSDPSDNFTDKSLWEKSRSESDECLRRLIRKGMVGSSVTCLLAGTDTWSRPYVRYEIAHSLFKKNGLLTVFIHNVNDPHDGYAVPGHNPLSHMGLELREDGKGRVCELVNGQWRHFDAMTMPVPWPQWLPKPRVGWLYPLSVGTLAYDYHFDRGHQNLPEWVQIAARAAGRP